MIRLTLILLFFLASLLAIFKAPAYYLWLLAIGVTEFPLIFAGITALLTLSGIWVQKYQLAGTVIGVITILIYLSPIILAYGISSGLEKGMQMAFGETIPAMHSKRSPFSIAKLFADNKALGYKNIQYVKYADTSLNLDYYPSQIIGKRACVIVIHGGSWSSGDSKQLPELNSHLARLGYNVASIDYRMAPEWQNPAPVQDVQSAIKYLTANAAQLNIDTNKFILLGRSAGAQIALLAAYTLNNQNIKGVIDFYGPADMVWGYSLPSNPLIMDSRSVMSHYLGGPYDKVPQNYVNSSPIEFVDKNSPPTLIIHGHNDVLVAYEHSRRLNEKLSKYGIKHYWLKLPWATHGFDYNLNGPGGQLSTYAVERFLAETTSPPTP